MIVCTENVFTLHTTHTSYQLAVAPNGMVLHTYYGTRLPEDVPSLADARMPHSDPGCWPDLLPQELSGCGTADNRTPAVIPEYADGTEAAAFVFDRAEVHIGKPQLPDLPMFRDGKGVETLSVFLKDACGLAVELRYSRRLRRGRCPDRQPRRGKRQQPPPPYAGRAGPGSTVHRRRRKHLQRRPAADHRSGTARRLGPDARKNLVSEESLTASPSLA